MSDFPEEPAWGWEYNAKMRFERLVVFQGMKRLIILEWTDPQKDPGQEDMKSLERKANGDNKKI